MKFTAVENTKIGEKYLYGKHKSGLDVYIIPKKGFSKYYAIYGTRYGSINQTFKSRNMDEFITVPDGVAHFLEHKLFEEPDGTNAFDKFAGTGASSNAFTSFDITAYLFTCTDKFYENLDILLSFVNSPYFTDENVSKEQGIIGQEIKMYDDEPSWRVFFNMLGAMYHNNPVKIDIAGTVESISKITPEVLYTCYKTFYNPSNMVLTLVGDIDEKRIEEYLDKYVKEENNLGEVDKRYEAEPRERVKEIVEQSLSVSQPLFSIGFKETEPMATGRELYKREIVTSILAELLFGSSSEFYMSLYSEGLIDSSFSSECELKPHYGFSAVSGESSKPREVYSRVLKYIDEVKNSDLIKEEDVLRIKKLFIGRNLRKYNNVENIGNDFISRFMCGINPLEYSDIISEITLDDIKERLSKHFDTSNSVLSIVNPA